MVFPGLPHNRAIRNFNCKRRARLSLTARQCSALNYSGLEMDAGWTERQQCRGDYFTLYSDRYRLHADAILFDPLAQVRGVYLQGAGRSINIAVALMKRFNDAVAPVVFDAVGQTRITIVLVR